MTAIGMLLIVIVIFTVFVMAAVLEMKLEQTPKRILGYALWSGILLVLCGVTRWLWVHMP